MKNVFLIGCLLLGIAFFYGCSDDDNSPFEGSDNYITAVTLTQAGTTYSAVIAGDSITVTVPYTVSLNGATVVFEHSELAAIAPDPSTITDWNNERQFRVTSHNNADKRYIYRVVHADISNEGDVVLRTQDDVKAFAEKEISVIYGNLVIGAYAGKDSVTDLSALSALREVEGSIIINNNYFGTDLNGLDHLEKIGSLKIGTAAEPSRASLLSMVRFPKLKEVGSEFIVNNTNVQWVQAPDLQSVGESLLVFSESLTSLTFTALQSVGLDLQVRGITEGVVEYGSLVKAIEFPNLKQIGGKLSIAKMSALQKADFPLLASANGMVIDKARSLEEWNCPALESCGTISFIPLTRDVDATPLEKLNLKALKEISGDLTLQRLGIKDLTGLRALEKVSGKISLGTNNSLVTWDLVNLKQAGGISIVGMKVFAPEVLDVSGVEFGKEGLNLSAGLQIGTIKGPEIFRGNLSLYVSTTGIEGFTDIEGDVALTIGLSGKVVFRFQEIKGSLNVSTSRKNNISFPDLKGVGGNIESGTGKDTDASVLSFGALSQVGGWLYVSSNALETFTAPNLKAVGKQLCLSVYRTWNVTEIDLPSLETVGLNGPGKKDPESHELEMGIGNIEHFSLPNLKKVRGDVFFDTSMDGAESISLDHLTTVTGTLYIYNIDEDDSYETLTTLSFPSLRTVGKIDIQYNGGLKDYTTFKPLFDNNLLPDGHWNASNNGYDPTWKNMKDGDCKM